MQQLFIKLATIFITDLWLRWFQFLKCEKLLPFIVLHYRKPNILGVWTVDWIKQEKVSSWALTIDTVMKILDCYLI